MLYKNMYYSVLELCVFCISCVWQLFNKWIYDDDDDMSEKENQEITHYYQIQKYQYINSRKNT